MSLYDYSLKLPTNFVTHQCMIRQGLPEWGENVIRRRCQIKNIVLKRGSFVWNQDENEWVWTS